MSSLLSRPEGRTLEFKAQLPDLSEKEGKATVARSVLAIANSLQEGEEGFVIYGVTDPGRGAEVCGIEGAPDADQITGILTKYTNPPPVASFRAVQVEGKTVGVITIQGSSVKPHHAQQQFKSFLRTEVVYIRRDAAVGEASSREIEDMLLERIHRYGAQLSQSPLKIGFVADEEISHARTLTLRVKNTTEAVVTGIDVLVDFKSIGQPELVSRRGVFVNMRLEPLESREAEIKVHELTFSMRTFSPEPHPGLQTTMITHPQRILGGGWLDATLRATWRDADGFIQSATAELALEL